MLHNLFCEEVHRKVCDTEGEELDIDAANLQLYMPWSVS